MGDLNLIESLRGIRKSPLYTLLNLLGLATGLAATFLILLFIRYELSFDRWMADSGPLFTVETGYTMPGRPPKTIARTPVELKDALLANIPGVTAATRILPGNVTILRDGVRFDERIAQVEKNFLDLIPLTFVEGSATTAFLNNDSIVLSETARKKYFGAGPALGETLDIGSLVLTVTGVTADIPAASHLDFTSFAYLNEAQFVRNNIDWSSTRVYTYLRLAEDTNAAAVEAGFPDFLDEVAIFAPEQLKVLPPNDLISLRLLNFQDVHLYGTGDNPIRPGGSIETVSAFTGVAILLIAIAIINYVNLATARSARKTRGIAMRKIFGASRPALIARNLSESVMLTAVSCAIALGVVEVAASNFFNLTGAEPAAGRLDGVFLIFAGLLTIVVGLAAGLYPAFYLSAVPPVRALAQSGPKAAAGGRIRNFLVLFQFATSILLIVAATVFYSQTRYASEKDLGFNRENLVVLDGAASNAVREVRDALKSEIERVPGVLAAAYSSTVPGDQAQNNVSLIPLGGEGSSTFIAARSVSPEFFDVYGLRLMAGRFLEVTRASDEFALLGDEQTAAEELQPAGVVPIVITESAVAALGLGDPAAAIGAQFRMGDFTDVHPTVEIIGVTSDVHFRSLRSQVSPGLFLHYPNFTSALTVSVDGRNIVETLSNLDAAWDRILPAQQIRREFLTEALDAQYVQENRKVLIFGAFAGLTILVACLGIFGLAAYAVETRTKEVGLRKILGASVGKIVALFLWQFSKPVILANVVALPLAAWLALDWLSGFAYRIELTAWPFLLAAFAALMIAWVTVSSHAFRVARQNPIRALRYE